MLKHVFKNSCPFSSIFIFIASITIFCIISSDELKRRFVRNPEPGSTPTIFKGPKEECDDKDFIPQFTKKGQLVIQY